MSILLHVRPNSLCRRCPARAWLHQAHAGASASAAHAGRWEPCPKPYPGPNPLQPGMAQGKKFQCCQRPLLQGPSRLAGSGEHNLCAQAHWKPPSIIAERLVLKAVL